MLSLIAVAVLSFPLEWNVTRSTAVPYEVEIDPAKVGAENFVVKADGKPLATETFAGKQFGSVRLRFTVPAGTKALACEGRRADALVGAPTTNHQPPATDFTTTKGVSVESAADGVVLTTKGDGSASYTVDVPEGVAGNEAQFEVEVENLGRMCWPNNIIVWQIDAAGKTLAEPLVDPRWASHIRPVGKRTLVCESGHVHPEAVKLRVEFTLSASKAKYDVYGYPITDDDERTAKLKVTRLSIRPGALLPFPKYRDDFFAEGVSGKPGDCAIRLGGDQRQATIWYQTRGSASWANIRGHSGDDAQYRDEKLVFFPARAGTVEAWLKPEWKPSDDREIVIFEGAQHSLCLYKGLYRPEQKRVFAVTYNPVKGVAKMMKKDSKDVVFKGEGKVAIPAGTWAHVAATFEPDGEGQFFVNGKRVFAFSMKGYQPVDLKTDIRPNDTDVPELYLGSDWLSARKRDEPFAPGKSPYYEGLADNWRVSTGVRYRGDFTPSKSFTVDGDTRAFFSFDRSYCGTSGGGLGWIPLTLQAYDDRVEHILEVEGERVKGERVKGERVKNLIQYWAKEIQPKADPRVQLDWLNYPDLPTVEDFAAARRPGEKSATLKVGDRFMVTAPKGVHSDFVEIENVGGAVLAHPMLVNEGEVDPRSFGDFRDSLLAKPRTEWETANAIFQYAVSKSDYFMLHTAYFPYDGGDTPNDVWFEGLGMLNSYCGFECGPLNTIVKNLFPCAGGLPASMTQGYGHSFEQVFFDSKNHVYDLSAQKFFPAMDNETAAYLEEMGDQPGLKRRHFGSADHFIRNATRPAGADHPVYQRKIAMSLKPGERFRVWFDNNGEVNDLMSSRQIDRAAAKAKEGVFVDYSERTHAAKNKIWRVNRFFPQYASGFLRWEGAPAAAKKVFTDNGGSFDYEIATCYPVVAAEYSATLKDGSKAPLEFSTDGGKTFRALGEGLLRYEVRARYRYTVRVKAPIAAVKNFAAMTQVQINARVYTGRLHAGANTLTLKGTGEGRAKVTVGWRANAKRLEIVGALCSGAIPGAETLLAVIDPKVGATELRVVGASAKAKVSATDGITATLKDGRLVLSAAGSPRVGSVKIEDEGLEKPLTVIVCEGLRLMRPADFTPRGGASIAKAGGELVQDVIVYRGLSDAATAKFAPIKAGRYLVFALERFPAQQESAIRSPHFRMSVGGIKEKRFGSPANPSSDYYKAMYGRKGERANWKWEYLVDSEVRYPYTPIGTFDLTGADELTIQHSGWMSTPAGDMEIAAALLVPDADLEFRCALVKTLCGLNTQAWKVK